MHFSGEILMELLQWAIPGGVFGIMIDRLLSPRVAKAKSQREVESIYKTLYEDLKSEVKDMRTLITSLQTRINNLERNVSRATQCPHYSSSCPIHELMQQASDQYLP